MLTALITMYSTPDTTGRLYIAINHALITIPDVMLAYFKKTMM